jgi:DNA-directed RNA polymerase specialized sigma24 family protein
MEVSEDETRPRVVKPQGLTAEGFDALLAQLDPDRERAGERYETIRRKLIRLFDWRGCDCSEDLADETINRVSRRMAEGVELRASDPYGYFCGVAHLVYKEVLRRSCRERHAIEKGQWPPPFQLPEDEEATDRRLECLRRCLDRLPQEQRSLILRYHQRENNIRNRQTLADEMEIPLNALRIRVHRVRRKLEACVHECLGLAGSPLPAKRFPETGHSSLK